MKNEAVLCECSEEIQIDSKTTPDFYHLYEQSVLLALNEQGVFNEIQLRYALDILNRQD